MICSLTFYCVQVSEEPDPEDPTARLVAIWGETNDVARNGKKELRSMLRMDLAAAVDSITPGVWQIVSMRIDPERVREAHPQAVSLHLYVCTLEAHAFESLG